MIDFFRPTERYGIQTQRLVARAQFGAADIFEIASLTQRLNADDLDAWKAGWTELGEIAQREAEDAEKAGHTTTAIERYFHASTYYQQSDIFTPSGRPERKIPFVKSQAMFRKGAALHDPEIRLVTVPCGEERYEGYWCLPAGYRCGMRVPTVLFIGGGDAYTEETYFSARGILDRGMAMLLLDLPGRGSSIYLKNIPARPDFEVPGRATMDWLVAQPEVDPDRIGISGISFGGYYGPRLAATDKRVKALASWGGVMNARDNIYLFHPRSQVNQRWTTGSSSDEEALKRIGEFDLHEHAPLITCPTLIVQGAKDTISDVQGAKDLFAAIASKDKELVIYTGPGAGHCQYDDWRHVVPRLFDFMSDRLAAVKT